MLGFICSLLTQAHHYKTSAKLGEGMNMVVDCWCKQAGRGKRVCVSVCEREGEKDSDPVYKHPSPVMSPLGRNEK